MTTAQVADTTPLGTELPSPAERPNADVVIYDGQCRFCTAGAARLAKWDKGERLAFVSLHDPQVATQWPDLTHDMLMEQMYVVDRQGQRHGGAAAFRYLTRRLPRLWLLAPLLHLPFSLPLWRWGYKQVAKRRYKIAGKSTGGCQDGACAVHFK
jgi:predicted DCC family thiol-disulfide oxidoreductase YuxK